MPRPRKTPIAVLPAITQADRDAETQKALAQVDELNKKRRRKAPNAELFPEAYDNDKVTRSTGVPIEQVQLTRPFGPGADYPSNTVHFRYYDPETSRTLQFHLTDATIDAIEAFCDMLEERGYEPCVSPDIPKHSQAESERRMPEVQDALESDKAIGRVARQRRMAGMPDDTSPVLTFGRYAGRTVSDVYHSGQRGESYVEWLANEAKDKTIRRAARSLMEE